VKETIDMGVLLHAHPELALFLSIVLGQIIGAFHWRGIGFGAVVGTLIAGIIVGIFAAPALPELLRWSFFYLFLFTVGYSVGPQFFGSLKRESLPQIALALVVTVSGLATTIAMAVLFDFDEGIAVGLLSGGMTMSPALGTGLNAINSLPIPDDLKTRLMANAPLADAITYGFGDLGLILFLTVIGPRLLRTDLRREARALEATLGGTVPAGQTLSSPYFALRAFRIDNPAAAGDTVRALEDRFSRWRTSVQRVRRGAALIGVGPELVLCQGDDVVVAARRGAFVDVARHLGPEIDDDPELLSVPQVVAAVVVTRRDAAGKTLAELGAGEPTRGVYLESLRRGRELMPRRPWTVVERGDVVRVVGAPHAVARTAAHVGFIERDVDKTDLAFIAGGICLGVVLGLLALSIRGVPLGLGAPGSILVIGLAAGWARGRYPVFGSIPEPAQRLLMDLGLIVFVAIIGLHAGPHAIDALRQQGGRYFASIFFAGMIVTIVPPLAGVLFARFVVKMNPFMILGGIAGAQTCPPGLTALREASDSNVATVAYTVPYAIGCIVITIWGPLVVAIVHAIRG
jgi:putative transport protein